MSAVVQKIEIKGKIHLFGGVYSNLQVLKKLKSIADKLNIASENCICTGHIIGSCSLPFYHQHNNYLWLNLGVIAMPANNGLPKVWRAVLEDAHNQLSFQHYSFEYNYLETSRLMFKNGLPKAYVDMLVTGIWNNMDILPSAEQQLKRLQIDLDFLNENVK